MSDILFEITKDNLETGLRGYPCGYCTTSHVDPQKGLFYVGRPVSELSHCSSEEVISLLYYGPGVTDSDRDFLIQALKERMELNPKTIEAIEAMPRMGHPMKLFCSALLALGMIEGEGDYEKDCLNLIAKMPHLVACVINHHAGWGKTPKPNSELGYMENFTQMLKIPSQTSEHLQEVMRLFNVLHFDHGGGNLSAFVGKAVASGLEDLYGSISAAMCALAGPRHGKANQDCLEFVQEIADRLGAEAKESDVESLLRHKLSNGELVFGFGHAVLRVEDPRASVQYECLEKYFSNHPLSKIARFLRSAGPRVLSENPKIACPYPNVDAVSGTLLTAAGFAYPQYYTLLFGLSRAVGISLQIVYERTQARDGKGTPIVRPKYLYKAR